MSGMSRIGRVLRLPHESVETGRRKRKEQKDMKYILMMAGTKAGVDTYRAWANEDIQAHFAFLNRFSQELQESGEFVATQPLAGPDEAKIVRAGKDGAPITDGVFPEAKEFLLGYWIVDVDSPKRAYEIAARLSAGPGPGAVPTNLPIEVRQIMSGRAEELFTERPDARIERRSK
jgi:hypothetical protein